MPFEDESKVESLPEVQPALSAEDGLERSVSLDESESVGEESVPFEDESKVESLPETQPQSTFEPALPKTPVNQFMVEKMGGLFISSDTVGINRAIVTEWNELFDGKQITKVIIEALDGRKTTCKFKTIKGSSGSLTGIIQIPARIRQTLQVEKGKLVLVKPVIE